MERQGHSAGWLFEWLRGITRPLAQGDIGALPVLLLAVTIDAYARSRRESTGR
jgi:hypothetical protein